MPQHSASVLVPADRQGEDGLRLPRPPGAIRRFWARHPRATDVVLTLLALLLSAPPVLVRSDIGASPTVLETIIAVVLLVLGAGSLLFRRRRPEIVFAIALVPNVLAVPGLAGAGIFTTAIALYSVAVYRSARACWIAFGAAGLAHAAWAAVTIPLDPASVAEQIGTAVGATGLLLIAALIGVNIGNRKRYIDALIARSQQLLVERDQQAQLAVAAERTRIAREMHDIVSHSLTVIVALADGAAATSDPERARSAARGAAETARSALTEMRAMLGVLRHDDEDAPLTPDTPPDPRALVTTAQEAGYPVTLTVRGEEAPLSATARFALGRVVQEGLTNAMRHARGASSIRILVDHTDAGAVVTIDDDGTSVPSPTAGFGLRGLRERLAIAGGTLEAGPLDDRGWRLRAVIPRADDDRPAPAAGGATSTSDDGTPA
jgi:signal transduction histidine kinase